MNNQYHLPSGLSNEAVDALLADLPEKSLPTYDSLSYSSFLQNHLIPNAPFILSSSTTSAWPARSQWASPHPPPPREDNTDQTQIQIQREAGPSRPNLSALRKYADQVVPVADTNRREFSEFYRDERKLGDVLDLWEGVGVEKNNGVEEDGDGITARKGIGEKEGKTGRRNGEGLYVKDWHLLGEIEKAGGGVGEVYNVPECFREDWLNPTYTPHPRSSYSLHSPAPTPVAPIATQNTQSDDFRFTYLGPSGTFTPLHRDVYASYSWSANIVGRKIWWLFPPDRLGGIQDNQGKVGFDVRQMEGQGKDGIRILQQEGEVIFVPSGWYHQVLNLDFCISINHNFISPLTLPRAYSALIDAQCKVEESIADVRDMIQSRLPPALSPSTLEASSNLHPGTGDKGGGEEVHVYAWEKEWVGEVQMVLKLDAGWNWLGFWECVSRNIQAPPAPPDLSTPIEMRNQALKEVLDLYKATREWIVLDDVRQVVEQIEALL